MNTNTDTKIVACAAEAHKLLSKLGVPKRAQGNFVSKQDDGFYVNLGDARAQYGKQVGAAPARVTPPTVAKKTTRKGAKRAGEKKAPRKSVAQRCLELFKAGKDNAATWSVVKREFHLDDTKAHYPGWYRAHFTRRGDLKGKQAAGHAH